MNEIFNFHGQEVRTLTIDDEPWFVGKDVADILGYAKPLDAISRHVDEDDSVKYGLTDNLGRTQNTIIINESGLYSLILSSKLPQAKEFKRWVTSEVLPAIRRQGGFIREDLDEDAFIALFRTSETTSHNARRYRLSQKRTTNPSKLRSISTEEAQSSCRCLSWWNRQSSLCR